VVQSKGLLSLHAAVLLFGLAGLFGKLVSASAQVIVLGRTGFATLTLLIVSRYIGDNLKVGLGYNFTDFSDDLTDLNYDHQGVFLNLTGSL